MDTAEIRPWIDRLRSTASVAALTDLLVTWLRPSGMSAGADTRIPAVEAISRLAHDDRGFRLRLEEAIVSYLESSASSPSSDATRAILRASFSLTGALRLTGATWALLDWINVHARTLGVASAASTAERALSCLALIQPMGKPQLVKFWLKMWKEGPVPQWRTSFIGLYRQDRAAASQEIPLLVSRAGEEGAQAILQQLKRERGTGEWEQKPTMLHPMHLPKTAKAREAPPSHVELNGIFATESEVQESGMVPAGPFESAMYRTAGVAALGDSLVPDDFTSVSDSNLTDFVEKSSRGESLNSDRIPVDPFFDADGSAWHSGGTRQPTGRFEAALDELISHHEIEEEATLAGFEPPDAQVGVELPSGEDLDAAVEFFDLDAEDEASDDPLVPAALEEPDPGTAPAMPPAKTARAHVVVHDEHEPTLAAGIAAAVEETHDPAATLVPRPAPVPTSAPGPAPQPQAAAPKRPRATPRQSEIVRARMRAVHREIDHPDVAPSPSELPWLWVRVARLSASLASRGDEARIKETVDACAKGLESAHATEDRAASFALLKLEGQMHALRGDLDTARRCLESAVGSAQQAAGSTLHALARTLWQARDYQGARARFEEAVYEKRRAFPPDPVSLARSLHELGRTLGDLGETEEAARAFQSAVAAHRIAQTPDPTDLAGSVFALALAIGAQGDLQRASSLMEEAAEAAEAAEEAEPRRDGMLGAIRHRLGRVLIQLGDAEEARTAFLTALEHKRACKGLDERSVGRTLHWLGLTEAELDEVDAARGHLNEAIDHKERAAPNELGSLSQTIVELARLERDKGDRAKAIDLFERGLELARKARVTDTRPLRADIYELALLLAQEGQTERAWTLTRELEGLMVASASSA